MKDEKIYQVLRGELGITQFQSWFTTREEAESYIEDCKLMFPEDEFWIEEGTDYITKKCRSCGSIHTEERADAYGIFTGDYCNDCYNDSSKYPYKKYKYDYDSYGERLENDY